MKAVKVKKDDIIERMSSEIIYWRKKYNEQCDALIKNGICQPFKVTITSIDEVKESFMYENIE